MFRHGFILGAGLLALAIAGTAGARPVTPRFQDEGSRLTRLFESQGDLFLVAQKEKEKGKGKHRHDYTIDKHLKDHKGETGEFHVGNTPEGHKIHVHLKKGKADKMSLIHHKDGKTHHHTRVVKAKGHHEGAKHLPLPKGGVHKVSLPSRPSEIESDVYHVSLRAQVVYSFVAFEFAITEVQWYFWMPVVWVETVVVERAVVVPVRADHEFDVRGIPNPPLLAPRRARVAHSSQRRWLI